jgi:hypothetical protein
MAAQASTDVLTDEMWAQPIGGALARESRFGCRIKPPGLANNRARETSEWTSQHAVCDADFAWATKRQIGHSADCRIFTRSNDLSATTLAESL